MPATFFDRCTRQKFFYTPLHRLNKSISNWKTLKNDSLDLLCFIMIFQPLINDKFVEIFKNAILPTAAKGRIQHWMTYFNSSFFALFLLYFLSLIQPTARTLAQQLFLNHGDWSENSKLDKKSCRANARGSENLFLSFFPSLHSPHCFRFSRQNTLGPLFRARRRRAKHRRSSQQQ